MWDQVTENKMDLVSQYDKIVSGYDFKALAPEAAGEAMLLLQRAQDSDGMLKAGKAFLGLGKAPGPLAAEVLCIYADKLLEHKQPEKAAAALVKGSIWSTTPPPAPPCWPRPGGSAWNGSTTSRGPQELFERTVKQYEQLTTSPAIRQAKIGLGDVFRMQGDFERPGTPTPPPRAANWPERATRPSSRAITPATWRSTCG